MVLFRPMVLEKATTLFEAFSSDKKPGKMTRQKPATGKK